ncbi:MAG: hypothetical protein HYW48_10735 [Deltaproteobacteria bacterium]|nr:hypothetical protein [Deltaproteobacteria bacterium]
MRKQRELIVIDPGVRVPGQESFNLIARMCGLTASYHLPALGGMGTLLQLDNEATPAGVVVLGSMASVNDHTGWQRQLERWLEEHAKPDLPMLGICYGHQLFAAMHGSTVTNRGFKAVGFRDVELCEDKRLKIDAQRLSIFVSHKEIVESVPRDFESFARSQEVSIEGLRHKDLPLWTLQAHVDATELFCKGSGYSGLNPGQLEGGQSLLRQFLSIIT